MAAQLLSVSTYSVAPPAPDDGGGGMPVAAIAGGIAGGVAALLVAAALVFTRRRRRQRTAAAARNEQQFDLLKHASDMEMLKLPSPSGSMPPAAYVLDVAAGKPGHSPHCSLVAIGLPQPECSAALCCDACRGGLPQPGRPGAQAQQPRCLPLTRPRCLPACRPYVGDGTQGPPPEILSFLSEDAAALEHRASEAALAEAQQRQLTALGRSASQAGVSQLWTLGFGELGIQKQIGEGSFGKVLSCQ